MVTRRSVVLHEDSLVPPSSSAKNEKLIGAVCGKLLNTMYRVNKRYNLVPTAKYRYLVAMFMFPLLCTNISV